MKKTIIIISIFLLLANSVFSQENNTEKKKKATFATKIVQNTAAGFFPIFFGNFETNKNFDITMYSIFWTNGAFGNGDGNDLLFEVAAGLGFKLFDNKLYLNPSLGFASGKWLSNSTGTKVGEGIIPSLYVNYNDAIFDIEGFLEYYKSIRDNDNILTRDFVLNWLAPGVKVGKRVVIGAYYETLDITRNEGGDKLQIYQWLGGSIKLKFDKGIAFRISAGPNLNTDVGVSDEFYRVSAFIPF
ncbi:hypothetical protein MHTCC0001_03730 [Flavobacteriaceae bacterium MHTCC 0001]